MPTLLFQGGKKVEQARQTRIHGLLLLIVAAVFVWSAIHPASYAMGYGMHIDWDTDCPMAALEVARPAACAVE